MEARLDKLDELLKGMKRKQEPEEVGGDSLLASRESTSATTQERTEKENTGSHNDQSTIINGAPRCSSPPTNFGTQVTRSLHSISKMNFSCQIYLLLLSINYRSLIFDVAISDLRTLVNY